MGGGSLQIGRDTERELVSAALREAQAGRPSALLIAGEPGIGKTSLVTEVTSGPVAAGHRVLWGRCLRFAADSSPYLPIGQILTQWHRQADGSERARVLAGAEHLATIAPALGAASGPSESARVLPLVSTVVDRIAETAPLVLVVDDVQWADGTSLDLLAYLVAGFGTGQRLSVVATYRDTELGEGHRLHSWLADVTRLPSVSRLRLERLGFADAEELVARLQAEVDGSGRLAAHVFRKADGNPYYTELLVRGSGGTDSAEGDLPRALLSAWHGLSADPRELLQLLAVGGRPVTVDVLDRLVAARGGTPHVTRTLAEATGAGLVTVGSDGSAWFHHPLIAEVVATTLTPSSRRQVHRDYVTVLEGFPADLTPAARAAHLALHHHGAGNTAAAFVWSLRAADAAATVRGYAEQFDHLNRACSLWEAAGQDARAEAGDRLDLLRRTSDSAWSAGDHSTAVRLLEWAIEFDDPEADPVRAVRRRMSLQFRHFLCGHEPDAPLESARAVAEHAARVCPRTPEHAQALARLSWAEHWNDEQELAVLHASKAVRMARRTGSSEALAWALCMRSQTRAEAAAGLADVLQAVTLAREVGEPELMGVTAIGGANCFERLGRRADAAELLLTTFHRLLETGSVHDAMWANPWFGAAMFIELGRWTEARDILRELLGRRHPPGHAAEVRGQAATLAFRLGDFTAGRAHLDRAHELLPGRPGPGYLLAWVGIEGLWVGGESRKALRQATTLMEELVQLDPSAGDELLPLVARIAADLAEQPGRRAEAQTVLDRLEQIRGTEPDWFVPVAPGDLLHPAWGSVFAAERARCHDDPHPEPLWRSAVSACRAAGQVWDETLASYQLARALLAGRRSRTEAASALRHAARLATELGAAGILREVEELARQAHIPLDVPGTVEPASATGDAMLALTPREREVLSHLVAGRTYAEIADQLFISEKTVSVHVSNLLRKTGTTSRLQLAELARRGDPGAREAGPTRSPGRPR